MRERVKKLFFKGADGGAEEEHGRAPEDEEVHESAVAVSQEFLVTVALCDEETAKGKAAGYGVAKSVGGLSELPELRALIEPIEDVGDR